MAKKMTLEDLKERICVNNHKISKLNKLIPFLGFLFTLTSFFAFYASSVVKVAPLYQMLLSSLLVVIILSMIFVRELINKKRKENRKFDYKMYYRLFKVKAG